MEIPGFHEALSEVVTKYLYLSADFELTLFELEKFTKKLRDNWNARDFSKRPVWTGNEKPPNTFLK